MFKILSDAEAVAVRAMILAVNNCGGEFEMRIPDATMTTRVSYRIGRLAAVIVEHGAREESFENDADFLTYYGTELYVGG